jgi:hypothetical protein
VGLRRRAAASSGAAPTAMACSASTLPPASDLHYREADGLPNDVVYALLPERATEGDRHLWLSTNRGLSRFDPQAGIFRNYTYLDGLQSNEFNWQAAYRAPDGEMFFGGVNGINAFYPDRIWRRPVRPAGLYHRPAPRQPAGGGGGRFCARALRRGGRIRQALLPGSGRVVPVCRPLLCHARAGAVRLHARRL